jgi:hypothetical protein
MEQRNDEECDNLWNNWCFRYLPDVNRGEDPDRVFFVADDRANLVYLKLLHDEGSHF